MAANRKLGRTTEHRMAMLRAMVTFLLENGRIETTLARAKEVAPLCEKMITLGKKNTLATRRQAMAFVTKEAVVAKLFSEIAPKYAERNGGYTRIIKTGFRPSDGAEMCFIELVDYDENMAKTKKKSTRTRRSRKSSAAVEVAPAAEEAVETAEEVAATEAPAEEAKAE